MPKDETDRESDRLTALWRAARDGAHLNDELAGRDTGRQARFLPGEAGTGTSDPVERRAKTYRDMLDLLLATDPIYAAQYANALEALDRAEAATEIAIVDARQDLAEAEAALEDVLDRASRLPDGRRAFRAADGTVYDEHGQRLSDAEAAGTVWKGGAPSYEDYLRAKKAAEAAQRVLDDLLLYQTDVLGHWRDRMEDRENPPTPQKLDAMQRQIDEKVAEAVRQRLEPDAPVATETANSGGPSGGIDVPKL